MTGNQGLIPEREPERRLPHPRKAAGAQITQCSKSEVVTRRNNVVLLEWDDWNGSGLNPPPRNNWRASLVPASAVIPAPVAYMNVVAVETLVVGTPGARRFGLGSFQRTERRRVSRRRADSLGLSVRRRSIDEAVTLRKFECSRHANGVTSQAWNNIERAPAGPCWLWMQGATIDRSGSGASGPVGER